MQEQRSNGQLETLPVQLGMHGARPDNRHVDV